MKHSDLQSRQTLQAFKGRSLLSTDDFSRAELAELLDLAVAHKTGLRFPGSLTGRAVALLFFNPSLRTRASMAIACQQLNGTPVIMDVGKETYPFEYREGVTMDGDTAEHIKEAAPVLCTYFDAIGVRCFPKMESYAEDKQEMVLRSFKKYSSVPVINLESALQHPLQALGDLMTIQEKFKRLDQRKVVLTWANHTRRLPMSVPNSIGLIASKFGMDLTIACPPEYELDPKHVQQFQKHAKASGGEVRISHDMPSAVEGAEVVYAKSWGSLQYYGRAEEELKMREKYRDWMVTEDLMKETNNGYFMHCLPVRRNVVVTDEVLDGPRSIVVDQAANRMHLQKTLLSLLLQKGSEG